MKTFTAVLLFIVILGFNIEADAGSFNLSGSWDPGISFGRTHSLNQKHEARNIEDDYDHSDWPRPNHINNFEFPESFNDPIPDEITSDDNEHPQAHHHEPHHRAHRH